MLKVIDILEYCDPSQEIEIWIKPLFGNRYTRYTTALYDEIRNDEWTMEILRLINITSIFVNTENILVIHGTES